MITVTISYQVFILDWLLSQKWIGSIIYLSLWTPPPKKTGVWWPRNVMVKSLNRVTIVSEFELQSYYYVHF